MSSANENVGPVGAEYAIHEHVGHLNEDSPEQPTERERMGWIIVTTCISVMAFLLGGDIYRSLKGAIFIETIKVWSWEGPWLSTESTSRDFVILDGRLTTGYIVIDDEAFRFDVIAVDETAIEASIRVYCLRNAHFAAAGTLRRHPQHANWIEAIIRNPVGIRSISFRRPLA